MKKLQKHIYEIVCFAFSVAMVALLAVSMFNEGKRYERETTLNHYLTDVMTDTVYVRDTIYM